MLSSELAHRAQDFPAAGPRAGQEWAQSACRVPHRAEERIGERVLDQWMMVLRVPQMSHSGGICRVLPASGHLRGSSREAEGLHALSFSSAAHRLQVTLGRFKN